MVFVCFSVRVCRVWKVRITNSSLSALTRAWRAAMSNWGVLHFEVHCHDRHCMVGSAHWVRPRTQLTQTEQKCVKRTNAKL